MVKDKLEAKIQAEMVQEIEKYVLPGSVVLHNDANSRQGIPDLIVLFHNRYAILEVKRNAKAPYQPNQEWYLDLFGEWSFSATIYPENKEEVYSALQQAFGTRR